jgi:Cellulase (glycosyl hydrolase family 5)
MRICGRFSLGREFPIKEIQANPASAAEIRIFLCALAVHGDCVGEANRRFRRFSQRTVLVRSLSAHKGEKMMARIHTANAFPQSGKMLGIIAITMLLAIMPFSTTQAQTPKLKVRGQLQYVHGVNIAWMFGRYSTDLGINPMHPEWGNGYNSAVAGAWLNDIDQMKVNVVRLWLFEALEGLEFDANGYVTGMQPQFLLNLDDMIAKANNLGLAYELVMITHAVDLEFGKTLPSGAVVKNFIVDTTARQRFLMNVVRPLALRYKDNMAVFAYDIMNESDLGVMRGVCTRPQLRVFAKQVATQIHTFDPNVQVTCSCAFYKYNTQAEHNSWYNGLGLDFYESHNYATVPNLKVVPAWLDKPLLLGEYGPSLPPPDYTGQTWTEADQNASANSHISQAKNRGWAGTLAWMYWHSPNFGESIAVTPGGAQDWESAGVTIKTWGSRFFDPPTPIRIYMEALAADWNDWSWDTTLNLSHVGQAFAGTKSIRATSTAAWSGLSLRKGTALSATRYTKLRFYIYSGPDSRPFNVFTQSTDGGAASPAHSFVTAPNVWTQVSVDLSVFGSPTSIKRINIQSMTNAAIGDFWIDNIELLP